MSHLSKMFSAIFIVFFLTGCTGTPEGITPVKGFDKDRYLGTWYEIARLDHSFEKGLSKVSAQYTLRDDGGIKVVNRGYSAEDEEWQNAEGKAFFVDDPDTGHLKVSFFGPFYASYVVFELDKTNYDYAFVTGYNKDYLWLLARSPDISEELKQRFLTTVKNNNYDLNELIWVEH